MRWAAMPVLVLVLLATWAGPARVDAAEYPYIAAGAALEYAVVSAPHPAEEIGRRSIASLALRRGAAPPAPEAPAALVWQAAAAAPFGAAHDKDPKAATLLGDPKRERVATLHVRRTFQVGAEAATVRLLRLRARYRDALVATVNGVEVARRNLAAAAPATAYAMRTHGPEWETIYVVIAPGLLRKGDNVLGLEVHPNRFRMAPLVDVELAGADGARIVRGPLVQRVGPTSATVVFETDLPSRGEVQYGATTTYDRRASDTDADPDAEPTTRHVIELTQLPADSEVHYMAITPGTTADARSADASFHTAPGKGEVVRFVVYGDVRSGHEQHADILAAVAQEAPDFLVATGDMVLRGSDEADWQRFFAVAGALLAHVPMYPVLGNHDVVAASKNGERRRSFDDIFALWAAPAGRPEGAAWYGFDVGDVHFAVLDSNRYDDDAQREWLAADLAAARERGARALFAAVHQGPWSHGPHGGDATAAHDYAPILEQHGVAVVFSGHDHLYERGRVGSITYVVSGGAGASLYKPRCGAKGQKKCKAKDHVAHVASEHHYVAVEVYRDYVRLCPRRPDGTAIEDCVDVPLRTPAR